MSQLIDFMRGTGTDVQGRSLEDLWQFSDSEFDVIHDFIQWMFPLPEPSRFNPRAPVLSHSEIAAFHADPALRENLLKSFERFLAFLGLLYREGNVERAEDFLQKQEVWLIPNHNWLRVTRVLASTRLLGLEDASSALFRCLAVLREDGNAGITDEAFRYWNEAAVPRGG
jgi:hypothetical protein